MKKGKLLYLLLFILVSAPFLAKTAIAECGPKEANQTYLCGKSDVNRDGAVDIIDLTAIRNHYTSGQVPADYDVTFDINLDREVNDDDYALTRESLGCVVPAGCVDSDCDNIYTQGRLLIDGKDFLVDKYGNMEMLADYCLSGSNNSLLEYSCRDGEVYRSSIVCDYGCENGRCLRRSCNETDNGYDSLRYGLTIAYTEGVETSRADDLCVNASTLDEFYCENRDIKNASITCQINCGQGACTSCFDFYGQDVYTRGTIRYVENGQLYTNEDECLSDGRRVLKYRCARDSVNQPFYAVPTSFLCPDGCQNGSCIRKSCSDSDGTNIYVATTLISSINGVTSQSPDFCVNASFVAESYCENNEARTVQARCPSGICMNGSCIKNCSDSDGGLNFGLYGELTAQNKTFRDSCIERTASTVARIQNLGVISYPLVYNSSRREWDGDKNNNLVIANYRTGLENPYFLYYNPSVLYENGIYRMWFLDNGNDVRYATSNNGINWNVTPNYVLRTDENTPIACARILNDNGTYKMWYGTEVFNRNSQPLTSSIYLRYANSSNGINWTTDNVNHLYLAPGTPTGVDMGCFSVLKNGNSYKLWFSQNGATYFSETYYGVNWLTTQKVLDNAEVSSVVYDGSGEYEMYFDRGGSIYSAISGDGINWGNSSLRVSRPQREIRGNMLLKPFVFGAFASVGSDDKKLWYNYLPNADSLSSGSMIAYATLPKSRYSSVASGESLLEMSCTDELAKSETFYNCTSGCRNGACVCRSSSECGAGENCINNACIRGPSCADGTASGSCSVMAGLRSYYCSSGILTENCSLCNFCASGQECVNNRCMPMPGNISGDFPPLIGRTRITPAYGNLGTVAVINTYVTDENSGVESVQYRIKKFQSGRYVPLSEKTYELHDDGRHGDGLPGDNVYGGVFDIVILESPDYENPYKIDIIARNRNGNTAVEREKASFSLTRENGNCIEAIPSFNRQDADRVNVVFVNLGSDMNIFISKVTNAVDIEGRHDGIFSVEPYKSNRNKLNFWYVNRAGELNKPYCRHLSAGGKFCEDDVFSLGTECLFPNKQLIALVNIGFRSSAFLQTGPSFISYHDSTYASGSNETNRVIVHEFGGHSFGGLKDEYIELPRYAGDPGSVNCYTSTDASTCRNSAPWSSMLGAGCGNQNTIDCQESDALYNLEVNCYQGCQYSDLIFRASFNTIMRNSRQNPYSFGPYDELLIARQLERFSGGES